MQAPGASNETKAGGYQLDGSSGSENHFLVDGLDMTSLRTGTQNNFGNNTAGNTPTNPIRTDFVAEVQVKSSGYNAEYRAATGGVVSVLPTKTGSNDLHGSAGDVLRHAPDARRAATDAASESSGPDDCGVRQNQGRGLHRLGTGVRPRWPDHAATGSGSTRAASPKSRPASAPYGLPRTARPERSNPPTGSTSPTTT